MAACLSPNFFFVLASPRVPSRQRDVQACGVTRRCECIDLHKDLVPYKNAWDWQKNILKKRHSCIELDEDFSDTLITLQHPPVYTLGTASSEEYLNFDRKDAPYEIFQTERGGEVTYHGPGQLVMYPIINLRYHKMDLHWYLRRLEEVVIRVLSSTFSIKASRLEGLTGVWVGNQKLAAIGIRVSRWVTYHGLALNVTTDLSPFKQIVPCGIRDRQVGSIKGLLLEEFSSLSSPQLLDITDKSLLKEFSEVFELDLIPTIRRSYNPTRHGSRDYNIYKTLLFAQAVFKACNGPGAVEEARVYFECMKDSFGVTPTMEHYLCLVDLLGKSGKFQEAKELVDRIPSKPSPLVLRDTLKLHLKI